MTRIKLAVKITDYENLRDTKKYEKYKIEIKKNLSNWTRRIKSNGLLTILSNELNKEKKVKLNKPGN